MCNDSGQARFLPVRAFYFFTKLRILHFNFAIRTGGIQILEINQRQTNDQYQYVDILSAIIARWE